MMYSNVITEGLEFEQVTEENSLDQVCFISKQIHGIEGTNNSSKLEITLRRNKKKNQFPKITGKSFIKKQYFNITQKSVSWINFS